MAGDGTCSARAETPNQYENSSNSGAKPKKKKTPGACFVCQQIGHFSNKCPDRMQTHGAKKCQVSTVKKAEIDKKDVHPVKDPEFQFDSLQVVANEASVKRGKRRQVDVKATNVRTPYATNPPMMTSVCLEDVCVAKFECDTAASHNVISAKLCKELRQ